MIWFERLSYENIDRLLEFLENNKEDSDLFKPHEFSKESLVTIIESCIRDRYILFYKKDTLVGYGLLRGWDEGYEIPSLGIEVDKKHRGKGLGKFFMIILHEIARDEGAKKIRLTVMKNNNVARKLYQDLGYKFHSYKEDRNEGILHL